MPPDERAIHCATCGFDLRGSEQRICPECGQPFDPSDAQTWSANPGAWRRRRWKRRVLFLGITSAALLAAAAAGIHVWAYLGWRAEQPTIAYYQSLGGSVYTRPMRPYRFLLPAFRYLEMRVGFIDLYATRARDEDLRHLAVFQRLRNLNLGNTNITDNGIKYLKDLPALDDVGLTYTQITDAAVEDLASLKLSGLRIKGTQMTREGRRRLYRLRPDGSISDSSIRCSVGSVRAAGGMQPELDSIRTGCVSAAVVAIPEPPDPIVAVRSTALLSRQPAAS